MGSGKKHLKVGGLIGMEGPAGEYRWNVGILDWAYDEARKFLKEDLYDHISAQVKEIACIDDPAMSDIVDVRAVDGIWEIRDTGGVLGKLNPRVFFGIDSERRCLVILGCLNKKNNGSTPKATLVKVKRRWRLYEKGDFGFLS